MLNAKAGPSVVCSLGCRTIRIHQIINKPEPSGWEENFKTAKSTARFPGRAEKDELTQTGDAEEEDIWSIPRKISMVMTQKIKNTLKLGVFRGPCAAGGVACAPFSETQEERADFVDF